MSSMNFSADSPEKDIVEHLTTFVDPNQFDVFFKANPELFVPEKMEQISGYMEHLGDGNLAQSIWITHRYRDYAYLYELLNLPSHEKIPFGQKNDDRLIT